MLEKSPYKKMRAYRYASFDSGNGAVAMGIMGYFVRFPNHLARVYSNAYVKL